jgi:DNA invertase Pin-like site-specific DNA recombinase
LIGLRAARWFRESTTGQFDAFGPDSQREQQDRAIRQFGLIDTGIEWSVAASGWTEVWSTSEFRDMLDRAGKDYHVLVVPYFSRFMRNIKQALIFRDEMHARGAAV